MILCSILYTKNEQNATLNYQKSFSKKLYLLFIIFIFVIQNSLNDRINQF